MTAADADEAPCGWDCASRAPLAERSAVNRQVLGSIPSGGVCLFFARVRLGAVQTNVLPGPNTARAHGATAARRIPDPKVGGSNPSELIIFF